jgi:hypothetical protein
VKFNLQITLDPSSSTAENLEALAPLVKSIQDTDSEQIYLKSLDAFVGEKEAEIERICEGNYEVGVDGTAREDGTCLDSTRLDLTRDSVA